MTNGYIQHRESPHRQGVRITDLAIKGGTVDLLRLEQILNLRMIDRICGGSLRDSSKLHIRK